MNTVEVVNHASNMAPILAMGGAIWWFRRWVKRTDDKIDKLEDEAKTGTQKVADTKNEVKDLVTDLKEVISDLKTANAVNQEKMSNLQGMIQQLTICIKETDKSIGAVTKTADKAWLVLQANNDILKVPDRLTGNRS